MNNKESDNNESSILGESFGCAVLDCGCTSTVCGEVWLQCYLESLNIKDRKLVMEYKGQKWFRFGNGKKFQSQKRVRLPCEIAGTECYVDTDVVKCDIPLLLSKPSMKRAKITLDLSNDKAVIFGNTITLKTNPSGHYCIDITPASGRKIEEILMTLDNDSDPNSKRKIIEKLHRQFAHPTARRLKLLLKDAGVCDNEYMNLVEEITDKCDICIKYKKTPPRPIVCMPLAKDFNEVVAMDLKEWDKRNNVWFLHLIDIATRFCISTVIHKKEKQVIIDKIIEKWIGTGLGCPRKFLSDNGGEFANEDFRDMCENLNIIVMNTAAESPFSNGICERNHAVIDEMVCKILADQPDLPLSTALAWAVHAKNNLQMVEGYSPYQLVFGRNPQLPSVCSDDPPALEGTTTSRVLAKHLNALHVGREAFIKAETSQKIRRALKHQIRPIEKRYHCGEYVYYKRDGCNEWKGPGKVIGQDGKVVIIKHGNKCVRIHISRVVGTTYNVGNGCINMTQENDASNVGNVKSNATVKDIDKLNDSEDDEMEDYEQNGVNETNNHNTAVNVTTQLPKTGQKVNYLPVGETQWRVATILGRAGKATGQYKYWLNVQNEQEEAPKSIDWRNNVQDWREIENSVIHQHEQEISEEVFVTESRHDERRVREAKMNELQNWKKYGVYEEVEDCGQPCISIRWVCTEKHSDDGHSTIKARLVARGFEENKDCNFRADAPTAGKDVLRIVLALLSTNNWKCNCICSGCEEAYLNSIRCGNRPKCDMVTGIFL